MNIVLFDCHRTREDLLPFTFTRPVADIRCGILTLREKWEKLGVKDIGYMTVPYLTTKFLAEEQPAEAVYIDGSLFATAGLLAQARQLKNDEALYADAQLLAFRAARPQLNYENAEMLVKTFARVEYTGQPVQRLQRTWDIFRLNNDAIRADFALLTEGRTSEPLGPHNIHIGDPKDLFIEPGARVEAAIFNTTLGPVYIGTKAEVMEGCMVRGPFALCHHAELKMGAKIYGATTIGPHCKVGGEVNNSVFFGFSNKAHDGFIGNSVIGEWCNLGADTNNSNLKNNYANVEVYSYREGKAVDTGLQFLGLLMGDHSKCGINTMFNTGTVVGVSCNIFGADFPPKFIPSFSWGGAQWLRTYSFDKAMEVANRVLQRRGLAIGHADKMLLREVFNQEATRRK